MTLLDPLRDGPDPAPGGGHACAGTEPITLAATPLGVREALAEMRRRFAPSSPGPDTLGMAETVLAEVLNNVVEHAYRRLGEGVIELRMERCGNRLCVDVRDHGDPMPDGILPGGALPPLDDTEDGPPEGGFGWFLIRAMARELSYTRENGQNRLCFVVPLAEA
ncbi:ATP-binding protein [Rhodovulum strictum]|uniref:ATP-binding protein n=1 Tax=Rhodovulum strictum TaxID=58314 RepID=A0A844B8T3_9RHOB|nr:ATP-binding protein [Rhodovulum strictum]MRH22020.1 ATP-binding protein [Rhodovulum strictum]